MSARRSRMSLGPGSLPALGNASGRANRRTSFGGSGSSDESNNVGAEPKKDRRAMLDEWRKSRASNNNSGASAASNHPPKSAPSPSRPSYSQSSYSNNNNKLSPIIASPNVDNNNNNSSYSARSQYDDLHNMNANNNRSNYEQQQEQQQPVVEKPVYSKPPSSAPSRVVQEKENPAVAADDMSGLTALERYRLRKQRQQQQAQGGNSASGGGMGTPQKSYGSPSSNNLLNSNNSSSLGGTPTRGAGRKLPPPLPPSHSGSSHNGEEEDAAVGVSTGGYGASSTHNLGGLGTPSRRGKSRGSSAISLGGAQRRVRRRTSLAPSDMQAQQQQASHNSGGDTGSRKSSKPLLPPSYPGSNERSVEKLDGDEPQQQQFEVDEAQQLSSIQHPTPTTSSLTTTNNFSQESHDSIDSAALKSRLQVMQKRIDNLEREKFDLNMSKAPLEARIRQKEDMWLKERERLMSEIENYQHSSKDVDERYRELEMKNEALEEQNSRLRLEARASASSSNGMAGGSDINGGNKDSWGERLKTNNEIKDLRKEVKNKDDEIKSLRIEKVSLESEVFGCQQEIETLERNYDELEKDYQELDSSKSTNIEAEIQLQALTTEHTATTAQLNATCADLEELKTRNKADLQAKEENWKSRESHLLFEMSVLKSRAGKSIEDDGDAKDDEAAEMDPAILKARIEERDRRITELEEQLLSGEQLRRALHNRIQELRGNIRVYVRTRPFLPNDGAASRQSSIDFQPDGESLTIQGKHVGEGHAFKFDKVFAPSTGQDMVFDEVSEFVQSALDGYNVCLFSYGQTGSGKTHTMQGSGNGAMRGIIPRAVEQILSQAAMMQSQRWTFTMKASFLEIYNEELRDLLVMMNSDGSMKPRDTRTTTKLSIKRNAEGKSFVDGINMVDIDVENKSVGLGQLEAVMTAAARARSVATTKMNAQSSRSHSVFMLHLCGSNEESGTVVQGALNLCDLAGSERLDRSGAGSDAKRLKETQAINKSLSSLGDVFTSLANGSKHIPFRNSKLTYLLQDCLSGDGKALMFVNLSPTLASSQESLCSLRFAQRVNSVELGKANKNVLYGGGGSSRGR